MLNGHYNVKYLHVYADAFVDVKLYLYVYVNGIVYCIYG